MAHAQDTDRTILVLDYPGPSVEKRVKHLGLERHGFTVRYLLREEAPRALTAEEYARELFERCELKGVEAAAILTWCTAAHIGRELLPLCSDGALTAPALIMFNPETLTASMTVRIIEAGLKRPVPELSGGLDDLSLLTLPVFEEIERQLVDAYLAEMGQKIAPAAQFVSQAQVDWAVHLVAVSRSEPARGLDRELHIVSANHPCPAGCAAEHLVAGETLTELFDAPEVVETVRARSVRTASTRSESDEPEAASGMEEEAPPACLRRAEVLDTLRDIWQDVLGRTGIESSDDFFEIGGDSVAALRVWKRAASVGIELPRSAVIFCPVLDQLVDAALDPKRLNR